MNFRGYFDLQIWFLMIFIPAISMRVISEEIKTNTLELLLTKPLSLLRIITGKYLSLLVYFSVFILSSIILYASLSILGNFPGGIIIAQMIGSILLIGAMFSVSFLASSITKNQVFAFLLAVLINFLLIIIGSDFIELSLPSFLASFLNAFSYLGHAGNFSKGIISLGDVFYFASIIFFGLYLSYVSIKRFQKTGKTGLGIVSTTELGIVLAILVVVNALTMQSHWFIDVTPNHIYTLSDSTKSILADVNDRVNIDFYASKELPPELKLLSTHMRDTVDQFNIYAHGNIHINEINPVEDNRESDAQKDGIPAIQIQTMKNDQFATQKGYLGLAIKYNNKTEVIPYLGNADNLEYSLVSKILKLTSKTRKRVDILVSDDIDDKVVQSIGNALYDTYDVQEQKITKDTTDITAKDDDIFILLESNSLNAGIIPSLQKLIATKTFVYFFQPVQVDLKNGLKATAHTSDLAKAVLDQFHLTITPGLAGDAKNNSSVNFNQGNTTYIVPYPLFIKSAINPDLAISEGITAVNTPFISSIEGASDAKDLITTSEFGFIQKDITAISPDSFKNISQSDLKKISLAKIITNSTSKTALIPNTYMWTLIGADMMTDNTKFLSNLVDFLGGDQRLIGIRSKTLTYQTFTTDTFKDNLIRGINIYTLPLLILLTGLGIAFFRNRKRA